MWLFNMKPVKNLNEETIHDIKSFFSLKKRYKQLIELDE